MDRFEDVFIHFIYRVCAVKLQGFVCQSFSVPVSAVLTFILLFQNSGVIVLFGPSGGGGSDDATADFDDEDDDDSDGDTTDSECDVNRPVSPCKIVFVGANAKDAGKSSIRNIQKSKKVSRKMRQRNKNKEFMT